MCKNICVKQCAGAAAAAGVSLATSAPPSIPAFILSSSQLLENTNKMIYIFTILNEWPDPTSCLLLGWVLGSWTVLRGVNGQLTIADLKFTMTAAAAPSPLCPLQHCSTAALQHCSHLVITLGYGRTLGASVGAGCLLHGYCSTGEEREVRAFFIHQEISRYLSTRKTSVLCIRND